jgi:hypothetical protein
MSKSNAIELNTDSWRDGEDADTWPRSRYSGVPMRPGWMAISIIISRTGGLGHSHIAFEWYADEIPADRPWQRRHELFHLLPKYTEQERQLHQARQAEPRHSSSGLGSGLTWLRDMTDLSMNVRPGEVRTDSRLDYFPLADGSSYAKSWMVPFEDGWRALGRRSRVEPFAQSERSHSE